MICWEEEVCLVVVNGRIIFIVFNFFDRVWFVYYGCFKEFVFFDEEEFEDEVVVFGKNEEEFEVIWEL